LSLSRAIELSCCGAYVFDRSAALDDLCEILVATAARIDSDVNAAVSLEVIGLKDRLHKEHHCLIREAGVSAASGPSRGPIASPASRRRVGRAAGGIIGDVRARWPVAGWVGAALGLVAAAGLTRLMSSLLFGVTVLDPVTYAVVLTLLVAAALLASYLPARRAMAVDPVQALRAE
jgi:hypothetical protein